MSGTASSKRSRDSFMSTPKVSYSMRARPRPNPSRNRSPSRMSSIAMRSAMRVGSVLLYHQGTMIAPVPSLMRLVWPPMNATNCMLSGIIE